MKEIDFKISANSGLISKAFLQIGIDSFLAAANWVEQLPYRRNKSKDNLLTLFDDHCGTCSTKHALLRTLAFENKQQHIKLMLGIFKMNGKNTAATADILNKHKIDYLPEAHNYLKFNDKIYDFTGIQLGESTFEESLLTEIEIEPHQISNWKVNYHKSYIEKWQSAHHLPYNLAELWQIREACILAITKQQLQLETDRISLRPFEPEDAAILFALNEDIEVLQYTGDTQFKDVDACREFLSAYDQYEKYAVGRMIVTDKQSTEIVGWCGLKFHPHLDEYDIGYRFFKKYWGKGYATESAKLFIKYGFEQLQLGHIVAHARKENIASKHVLLKIGLPYYNDYQENNQDWELYKITKETYNRITTKG